jgi:hydrogenase expression/formation protein HypE
MEELILLGHGSGGGLSHELIETLFVAHFGNPLLLPLEDASLFRSPGTNLVFTTDSYVVQPLFFPGGDIGRLAVCGTINDLSMRGARPLFLSAAFIIEEGLPVADLERVVKSMARAAKEGGVQIVCGDTKVVEKRAADKLFVTTSGIGVVPEGIDVSVRNARPGDAVIVSGTIGDHGMTILSLRQGLQFKSNLESDAAPLNGLVESMLAESTGIRSMRDPTRGGLTTTLNEIAHSSQVGIEVDEMKIPVSEGVQWACEMLGLDPLYLANEGKLVAVVCEADADRVVKAMQADKYGKNAVIIGTVTEQHPGRVVMRTRYGVKRIIDVLASDQFPRIC